MSEDSDIAIVGSGPYALSLAAHLRPLGLEFRIFGPAMRFWRDQPPGSALKTPAAAMTIAVPGRGASFAEWCRTNEGDARDPRSLASFAEYGQAVQRRFVPELEQAEVARVSPAGGGAFELRMAHGERFTARRVVFATGLAHMASVPDVLAKLPPELVTHSSAVRDYDRFRGRDVAIVGGGASAIEAGAAIHAIGGNAEIFVRRNAVAFDEPPRGERSRYQRLRRPASVFGYGLRGRALELAPFALRFVPPGARARFVDSHTAPAGAWWSREGVAGKVPIFTGTEIVAAERVGDRIRLRLKASSGECVTEVDHVIAGTGYAGDVDRLPYLDDELRQRLRRIGGAPALSPSFQSSVENAYFTGPIASASCGPVFRFVSGTAFAAPSLALHLAGPVRAVVSAVRHAGSLSFSRGAPAALAR